MNKALKMLSVCLAMFLTLALVPLPARAKRPANFNEARLRNKSSLGGEFLLEIGDMDFGGYLTIAGDSEGFLDDMISEVLDEMDMSDTDFDALEDFMKNLFDKQDMADEDWDMLSGKLWDKLGVSYDDLADAIDAIDTATKINWEDGGWYEQGGVETADYLSSGSELPNRLKDYLNNNGLSPDDLFGDLSGFKEAHDRWQSYDQADPDYQLGMDAFKRREEFYKRLNEKLENALKDGDGKYYYAIVFRDAKDTKPFTLFGAQCTETWTLNMVLKLNAVGEHTSAWNPLAPGNSAAEFKGNYTIEIEYDLSNFQSSLHSNIWNMGEIGKSLSALTANGPWNLANHDFSEGTCNVKRTLAGYATAQVEIYREGDGRYSIVPIQNRDVKDVSFSGIDAHFLWKMSMSYPGVSVKTDLFWDMELKADENGLKADFNNGHGTTTNTLQGSVPFSESPFTVNTPWEGTIWDRGDEAKDGWKLTRWR